MHGKTFSHCPKCGHTPLPKDQSLPAACPACGLILAKFGMPIAAIAAPARVDVADAGPGDSAMGSWLAHARAAVTYVPSRVDPTTFWVRVAILVLFSLWGVWFIRCDFRIGEINQSFLHGPLLVFHEAGHVVFRPFGEFLMFAGGTLGQLLMPGVMLVALLVNRRDPFGASIGLWLLGVSLLDVAPYIYDALEPQLILLGGRTGEDGGHDWIYLLTELGLLQKAQTLGWLTHKAGALVVLLALAWGAWLLWRQRDRLGTSFEEDA